MDSIKPFDVYRGTSKNKSVLGKFEGSKISLHSPLNKSVPTHLVRLYQKFQILKLCAVQKLLFYATLSKIIHF